MFTENIGKDQPVTQKLKVLMLEDVKSDAELVQIQLEESEFDCEFRVTEKLEEFVELLDKFQPDIVISDFRLSGFTGMEALEELRKRTEVTPFIFVTGTLGEENAVEAIKKGATDFIIKGRTEHLPAAILRALREKAERQSKENFGLQLEEREKRFRGLIENSHDAFMMFDEEDRISYVSPAIFRILGFTVHEFEGKRVKELVHPDELETREMAIEQLKAGKVSKVRVQQRFIHKNHREVWVDATITDQRQVEGVNAFVSNFRDITEQVSYMKEIEDQNRRLHQVAWMQSHEVRAPLARIMALIELIKDEFSPDSEKQKLLTYLTESANELDQVVLRIVKKTEEYYENLEHENDRDTSGANEPAK